LGEDDAEDVAEGGERDEDGESASSGPAHDVAEEVGGNGAAAAEELGARNAGEVGDVAELEPLSVSMSRKWEWVGLTM
jgi:hypothetical protein